MQNENFTDEWFIFGGERTLATTTLDRKKDRAIKNVNIKRITIHQMRHSFVTILMDNQINPATVSSLVGHSNPTTTLEHYTHSTDDSKKRALELSNELSQILLKMNRNVKNPDKIGVIFILVEVRGIEPLSKHNPSKASTV